MDWLRTQILLAIFILLMIYFLVSYFMNKAREPFVLPKNKTTNIDGTYKVNEKERYSILGGPLKTIVDSTEECSRICKNQPECSGKNATCTPSYSSNNCNCSFLIEGFETVANTLFSDSSVTLPVWKYRESNDWISLKRQQLGVWKDTNIKDINNMTLSFVINIQNNSFPGGFNSIIQVTKPGYTLDTANTLPWYGNDRYIGVWIYNDPYYKDKYYLVISNISTKTSNDYGDFILLEYNEPMFIVISNNTNNITDVLVNGVKRFTQKNRQGTIKTPEPDANILMMSSFDSIKIKDLQMYNGVFLESTAKLIYKKMNTSKQMMYQGQGCCRFTGWTAKNIGLSLIPQCKQKCLDDPKCVAADMARPNDQKQYDCWHFYETTPGGSDIIDTTQCGTTDPNAMCYKK
jgi:hypothetical protein